MFQVKFEVSIGKDKPVKRDNTVEKYNRQNQQKATRTQQEDEEFDRVKVLVLSALMVRVEYLHASGLDVSITDSRSTPVWIANKGVETLRVEFIALHRKITFVKTVGPITFNQSIDIQSPDNLHRFAGAVDGTINDDGIKVLVDKAVDAALDIQPGL